MRPQSIIRFEQAYIGSIVVFGINTALGWGTQMAAVEASFARMPEMIPAMRVLLIVLTLSALFVSLLLWYFTARKASEVTKWIIVAFLGLAAVGLPYSLAGFEKTGMLPAALNLVTFALNAVAVWMLFRPDASAWFRASDGSVPPPPPVA